MKNSTFKRRRKHSNFNPDHNQVQNAVSDFLKDGGRIKRPGFDYDLFMDGKCAAWTADNFLMGE